MNLSLSPYKGTRDLYPEDMRLRRYIFETWATVVEGFGYEKYDAPLIEPLELYAAKTGEEIVNEQTYTFTDRGERKVAIRPEMTPSLARMVAARRQELPLPARLYSIANFMRYERPQKGREREFWQLNVDIFGVAGIAADVEIISLSSDIVKAFGASDQMFTIRINDRRLTDFIMRRYLGLDERRAVGLIKLFDRRAKISTEDFNLAAMDILGESQPSDGMQKIAELLAVRNLDDLPEIIKNSRMLSDLQQLFKALSAKGLNNAKFDISLMRGFDYYTGIVFEVYDEAPDNRRAMFGGGRYDDLIGLFGVESLPVVGMAPGETTFIEFLKAHKLLPQLRPTTQIMIIPIGQVDVDPAAAKLRAGGLKVAVDYTGRKTDKLVRSAVKAGLPYLLFIGQDEIKDGKYTLKNVLTQEENRLTIPGIIETI